MTSPLTRKLLLLLITPFAFSLSAFAQISFTIEPQPTPLKGQVAFTASFGGRDAIFVLDLDAQRVRKVVDGPGNSSSPAWSPNGRYLAFSSSREGGKAIYLSDFDGSSQRRLSSGTRYDDHPAWKPDGTAVAFTSSPAGSNDESSSNIYQVEIATGAISQLTKFKGRNSVPRFSPSGSEIAFTTSRFWPGWDVCLFNLKERSEKCILSGSQTYCRGEFSRSGTQMAYSVGFGAQIDLHVLNLQDKDDQEISNSAGRSYDATWAPDDLAIVFATESATGSGQFALMISDLKEKPRPFLSSNASLRHPAWTGARTAALEAMRFREQDTQASSSSVASASAASVAAASTAADLQNEGSAGDSGSPNEASIAPGAIE